MKWPLFWLGCRSALRGSTKGILFTNPIKVFNLDLRIFYIFYGCWTRFHQILSEALIAEKIYLLDCENREINWHIFTEATTTFVLKLAQCSGTLNVGLVYQVTSELNSIVCLYFKIYTSDKFQNFFLQFLYVIFNCNWIRVVYNAITLKHKS